MSDKMCKNHPIFKKKILSFEMSDKKFRHDFRHDFRDDFRDDFHEFGHRKSIFYANNFL